MISPVLLAIFIVCWCIYVIKLSSNYIESKFHLLKASKQFPGPRAIPFIGSPEYFMTKPKDVMDKLLDAFYTYSSPTRFWMGNNLIILITEPDQIKTILTSRHTLEKGFTYKLGEPWVGQGLSTAPVNIWTAHRKLIAPSFNQNAIQGFIDIFIKRTLKLIDELKDRVGEQEFDISQYLSRSTIDIITETAMGMKNIKISNKTELTFHTAIERMKEIITTRMLNLWMYPNIIFNLTSQAREQRKCLKVLHTIADKIIQERLNYWSMYNIDNKETPSANTFLDHLIKLSYNKEFSQQAIRDEVNTILLGGSDTVSVTSNFAIFMLANFPEIQEKVYNEISKIYESKDLSKTLIKYEDLERMKYLERVILETLRLFPVTFMFSRKIMEDLNLGKFILPKGCEVVISTFKVHRHEKYWTDVLKFDPDRFLQENVKNRHTHCYLPFSIGKRNCIGTKYAMILLKLIISNIIRSYILSVDKKTDIKQMKFSAKFALSPAEPLKIKIQHRDNTIG